MKLLILAIAVVCAQARPDDRDAQIVKFAYDNAGDGSYNYAYETSNGIAAQEDGALKQGSNSEYPAVAAKGTFSYKSPEGEAIALTYVADENGYQPQGSHLPTPPPVPEHILRSIQYIEAHPPPPPRP